MKKILAVLLTVSLLLTLSVGVPISSAGAEETVSTEAVAQTDPGTEAPTAVTQTDEPTYLPEAEAVSEQNTEEDDQKILLPEEKGTKGKQTLSDDVNKSVIKSDSSEGVLPNGKTISSKKPQYVKGEAVVLLEDENALAELKKEVTVKETITLEGTDGDLNFAVVTDKGSSTQDLIEDLSDEDGVDSVVPNAISTSSAVSNDPYAKYQWTLQNTGQNNGTAGLDINPETAWKKAASTKKQCVVAVMDSGVDTTHKDLKSVLWRNTNSKLGPRNNCGYDFTGTNKDHVPRDDDGHGTHVAGIIAASSNNNLGVCGINKTGVKIMALKVLDKTGSTTFAQELKAFQYIIKAKKLGVNIRAVNCSFGGLGELSQRKQYDKIFNTMGSLGIVACVSAGNEDDNIDYKEQGLYYLPSSSQSPYCLTVAATDENGYITSYSNYGTKNVDIAAPGNDILSTAYKGTFSPSLYSSTAISTLCSYYQGYDENGTGSFGLDLRNASGATFSSYDYYSRSSEEFCGTGGQSLKARLTNATANRWYAFELPYTLSSSTENYSVSAVIKCTDANVQVFMYDIPAYYSWEDGPMDWNELDETWTRFVININPSSTKDYRKGTSRRLGFAIYVKDKSSATVYFDHIAVSKQGVSSSKFGKLDYKSGTSMAAPAVAGAVALVANAYPSLSASDIIKALKNSATKSSKLKKYVNGGRLLNLKNIAKYAKAYYSKATPKITKVTNTASGVKITIGKVKGAARYRVFYKSGTKWRILGDTLTTTYYHKKAKSGKKYTYTVRCVTKNGKTYQSDYNRTGKSITYVAVPKPTLRNIAAGVRITFKKVSGAAKYRIFRKAGNGKWVKLCDTAKTTVIDRSVKRGGTYRYKIRSMNKKGKYVSAVGYATLIRRVR